jgi:hypothetical protein
MHYRLLRGPILQISGILRLLIAIPFGLRGARVVLNLEENTEIHIPLSGFEC